MQFNESERIADNPAADVTSVCPSSGFTNLTSQTDPTLSFDIRAELEANGASLAAEFFYTFRLCVSLLLHESGCTERTVAVLTTAAPRIDARFAMTNQNSL